MRKPVEFESHPLSFEQAQRMRAFRAVAKRVIDGDTITVMLDVGFFTYVFADLRIADINTPEIVGEERAQGLAAKAFTESFVLGKPLIVMTELSGSGSERMSFERYVAGIGVVERNDSSVTPFTIHDVGLYIRDAGFDKLHPVTP